MLAEALTVLTLLHPVHDSTGSTAFRSPAYAWCCSAGVDCFSINGVRITPRGFQLPSGELVPITEALPSEDGQYWRCADPSGKRRCFFAPPGSS